MMRHIDNKHNIHFITYGDEKFKLARQRLIKEANEFGVFKSIKGYCPNSLTSEFKNKYNEILKMPRGGGYWIWKLDIIKQTVNNIPENDFIVYLDAGCTLNLKGIRRFYEYIKMFENTDYGILSFQTSHQEKIWTTNQILNYFNITNNDTSIIESGQYVGGVLLLRNNDHLRKYINMFEKCIEQDKYLITDKYNNSNQSKIFRDNRHDQSISSIIRKKIGSIIIERDESWIPPFGRGESLKYPFWSTRLKK